MSIAATTKSENGRGIVFSFTGDGASTAVTVTSSFCNTREQTSGTPDTATSTVFDTPTAWGIVSGGLSGIGSTGMISPTAGTPLTVSSTVVNAGNTITVNFSAAPTSGHTCAGWVAFNQDRQRL